MSGDVQPRRRKDKKRRKDETGEQIPTQPFTPTPTNPVVDDLNIHVHHEGGTGGGICAKIVFFLLFSALIVVIGLIINEHRGLNELDTVDSESRYSQIFEGWIDNSPEHDHDNHLETLNDEHDEHEEHDDHDDEEDNISDADEHDEEDDTEADEDDNETGEDETELSEEANDEEDEDNSKVVSDENNDEEDDDDTIEQSDEVNDDQTVEQSEEQDDVNDVDSDEKLNENDSEEEQEDDEELNTSNIESEEDKIDDDDEDEDKGDSKELDDKYKKDDSEDKDLNEDNEVDDNVEAKTEKVATVDEVKSEAETQEEHQENSSMAVKLGVGVALLVVAHIVLVRKWKSAPPESARNENTKESTPDMSRRNTLVIPPSLQEVEPDLEQDEEEYTDEEGELESEDEAIRPKSAKAKYQELRTKYTRSVTPESEPEYQNKSSDEYEEECEEEEDEEDVDSENEGYDEDEDEELLKRLEAKYGKIQKEGGEGGGTKLEDEEDEQLSSWKHVKVRDGNEAEESDSDKQSDDGGYEYTDVTNKDDFKIKESIDKAQKSVEKNAAYAIKLFDAILEKFPSSPRSLYGKALSLDYLADQKKSNAILNQALSIYLQLLKEQHVPDALFRTAADKCISRMRFVGQYSKAVIVHKLLMERFPNDSKYANDLAVTYLTINRIYEARSLLKTILAKWPNDGLALVHFGFILKTVDNNLKDSIYYMRKGMATKEEGVMDGRFYFHLGDALARLGHLNEAMEVYEAGVKNKVFLSKYQRSLYNVPRLTGKPWWKKSDLLPLHETLFEALEIKWKEIRKEGLAVLSEKGYFQDEAENLRDTGDWKQFELFARGQKNEINCKKCPVTCQVIQSIPDVSGCRRGQTKFSVMHPGTHIWPHCGPTNCRLRIHLGLKVPTKTYIRVAEETRSWKEGKVIIFDDSFEHEVWHNGTDFRLVLIIDIWHPQLTVTEKRSLSPI